MTQKTKRRRRSASRVPPSTIDGYSIAVTNRQRRWPVKRSQLKSAVATVLRGEGIAKADVSVAVVNDAAIHKINRQFLNHDEPTDVISFVLEQADGFVDGEIVVSADTAEAMAKQYGWTRQDELLLYVIHGALHLTGYDDLAPTPKRRMRWRERHYMQQFGIEPSNKSQMTRSK